MSQYNKNVVRRPKHKNKLKIDWGSFFLWIGSVVLSLIPVYVAVLEQLGGSGVIDLRFVFDSLGKNDILWLFSTVLLFCCFNSFSKLRNNKIIRKGHIVVMSIIGIAVSFLLEVTWYAYKYRSFEKLSAGAQLFLVIWGLLLSVIALIISTPLQIDFVSKESDK